MRTLMILIVLTNAMLLGASPATAGDAEHPSLPPACMRILSELHDVFANATAKMTPGDAIATLQSKAGPVCGFDLTGHTPNTIDERALRAYLDSLGSTRDTNPLGPDAPDPTRLVGGMPDTGDVGGLFSLAGGVGDETVTQGECNMAGAGPGMMEVSVLGVKWPFKDATGSWQPVGDLTEVSGGTTGASGVQTGPTGILTLVSVPFFSGGSSHATCVTIVTVTEVEQSCSASISYLPWTWSGTGSCKSTASTTAQMFPCSSIASQDVLSGIAHASHKYRVSPAPKGCQ